MGGEFVTVLSRADLTAGKTRTVEVGGRPLALCNVGGDYFAVDDTCPHAGASLGEGHMEGDLVICPLHDACFNVRTGEAVEGPATTSVGTYAVRVVGEAVQIAVPAGGGTGTDGASEEGAMERATFGAGCFWGVQAAFDRVKGVIDTQVGYAGGIVANPTYQDVCTGKTGHAEVIQVDFDPKVVTYDAVLDTFWECHDPTQMNRQGPDVGTQYRSVIFFHSPEQEAAATAAKARQAQSGGHGRPVVTAIEKAGPFWRAEEYHQKYLEKRGLSICH